MLKISRIIWDIIFIVVVAIVPEFIAEKIGLYTSIMEVSKWVDHAQ